MNKSSPNSPERGNRHIPLSEMPSNEALVESVRNETAEKLLKEVVRFLQSPHVAQCLTDRNANWNADETMRGTARELYGLVDSAGWNDIRQNGMRGKLLELGRPLSEKLRLIRDQGRTFVTQEGNLQQPELISFHNEEKGYLLNGSGNLRVHYAIALRENMMPYNGVLNPGVEPEDATEHYIGRTTDDQKVNVTDMLMLGVEAQGGSRRLKLDRTKVHRGWETGFTQEEYELMTAFRKTGISDPNLRARKTRSASKAIEWRSTRLSQRANKLLEEQREEITRSVHGDIENIVHIGIVCDVNGKAALMETSHSPHFFANRDYADERLQTHFKNPKLTMGHAPARQDQQICFDNAAIPLRQQIKDALGQISKYILRTPEWRSRKWSHGLEDILSGNLVDIEKLKKEYAAQRRGNGNGNWRR